MKRILSVIALMLCLSLVGCSSGGGGIKASWDSGTIKVNGKTVVVDDYYGYGATAVIGSVYYTYGSCNADDVTFCDFNEVGVTEANMDTFKKAMYFRQFADTEVNEYILKDKKTNEWYYGHSSCTDGSTPMMTIVSTMYDFISTVKFGNIDSVSVNGMLTLTAPDFDIHVRATGVSIPSFLKITQETKSECTQPMTVGTTTVYYYNSGSYDYYQYGDLLIQVVVGTNISDYITFK